MAGVELFLSILALCLGIYVFGKAWFFSSSMVSLHKRTKAKVRRYLPFLPSTFVDFMYFDDNSRITIIWSRLMATLFLLMAVYIFVATLAYGS